MAGVSAEDISSDMSKIKESVKELIEASGDLRYDLILDGGTAHAWITELGSAEDNGSFAEFVESARSNECTFEDMTVDYTTGEKSFHVIYGEYFTINNAIIETDYARYENKYVDGKTERKSDTISLNLFGRSLVLNFNDGIREEGK
jgi:hypothetical protein